jgi:cytochrome P450
MSDAVIDVVAPPWFADMVRVETYAEIDEILKSTDFVQGSHRESGMFLGGTLLTTDGSVHAQRRKLFNALFSRSANQHYELAALVPVIGELMDELKGASRGADGLVRADVIPLIRAMLFRITAIVAGLDGVDTAERTERLRFLVERVGEGASVEWSVRPHDEVIAEALAYREELISEYYRPSFLRRQELVRRFHAGEIARADLPQDVFTLIALHIDALDPDDATYIWREASLFVIASVQTTTHTLPHVVRHVYEWCRAHPEDEPRMRDADFLRRAAGESLRLHAPTPTLTRLAARNTRLKSSGLEIREGERVALFFPLANRETAVYGPDARQFNPHREAPQGLQPWGLSFGAGIHMCIGRSLVTGMFNRTDDATGTEGTMVKIVRMLFEAGAELDPADPPERGHAVSYHDHYSRFPVILRNL